MPIYEFVCITNPEHLTQKRTGIDEDTINCPTCDIAATCEKCELTDDEIPSGYQKCDICHLHFPAVRRPFYEDTAVQFPGVGFTRTSIPPAPPKPTTIPGESTENWFEKLDEFAEKNYNDDENIRPYRKEQAGDMVKQLKRGALP